MLSDKFLRQTQLLGSLKTNANQAGAQEMTHPLRPVQQQFAPIAISNNLTLVDDNQAGRKANRCFDIAGGNQQTHSLDWHISRESC